MPRILDTRVVRRVQRTALANGGSVRPFADGTSSRTVLWNVAGNCSSPITVELHGRKERMNEKFLHVGADPNSKPNFVEMEVACRKCENCLRRKSAMWRLRAMHETRIASRSWLATFTLNPASLVTLLSRARVDARKGGFDYDGLSGPEKFLYLEKRGFTEIQLWLKRLRKISGKSVRYLCVTEAHKSGNPHWHLLLHEVDRPLSYDRELKGSWPLGFDSYKLVRSAHAAGYVAKYLSKDFAARVRASKSYGGPVVPALPPKVKME